jgi:hypothetical protein
MSAVNPLVALYDNNETKGDVRLFFCNYGNIWGSWRNENEIGHKSLLLLRG